jgi:hypothetical protein
MCRALLDNEHVWIKVVRSGKNYQGPVEEVLAYVPGAEKAVLDIGFVSRSFIVSVIFMFTTAPRAVVGLACGECRCGFTKLARAARLWSTLQGS